MRKSVLVGVACFTLGAASAWAGKVKRNEELNNEALNVLCARFKNLGGPIAGKRDEGARLLGMIVCDEAMP